MTKSMAYACAVLSVLATNALAQTAVWTNPSGGVWTNAANWQGGNPPGPGTNVDINANGTYTNTASGTNACLNIALGTTSTSGMQTLAISGSAPLNPLTFSNMTVGALGVFSYQNNSSMNGTGLVTVASGGQLYRSAGSSGPSFGGHDITVQGGGQWTIASGATDVIGSDPGRSTTYTINGTLNGPGTLSLNNNGNATFFSGTGRLDVAQITFNGNNGNLYLGGSLTVNSTINQTGANGSTVTLTNGAAIVLNGPYQVSGGGSALLLVTNTDSATVTGTNLIYINHSNNGQYMYLSGTKFGNNYGGTLTIAGSGELDIQQTNFAFYIRATVLNLQRNTRIWGGAAAAKWLGPYNSPYPTTINVGAGATLTLDTNCTLRLERFDNILNVTNGASLAMRQGILEGGSISATACTNVCVGCGSPGTFVTRANSTNVLRRASTSTGTILGVLLGSNATASVEDGSVLQLQECRFAVGITNANSWGWKSAGTIEILSNSYFEAMSSDLGTNVLFSTVPFGVKTMRFSCPANLSNTLWNAGSADNDGDGTNDAALYVGTLDLSGMTAGRSVVLGGSGIAAPKLYYVNLVNPNGNTLSTNILALGPQNATVSCTFTNSPIPAGAQWRLTSGPDTGWKNSGEAISLTPGAYTQTFQTIQYFLTPPDLAVVATAGQTMNTQVGYATNASWGSVKVTIQPAGAVTAGAQWRLTTGPQTNWQASGTTLPGLVAGSYTVTYMQGVPAWMTPADDPVTVTGGTTANLTPTYASTPVYALTVVSPYGSVTPPVGIASYLQGTAVTCTVNNSPLTLGTTQYACTGWMRTGSNAGSGTGTNITFSMTTDTVQTWQWQTNYFLQTAAGANGTVNMNGTWWNSSSNATVTATPNTGYQLASWSGDVPSGSETSNPLVMPMNQPRSVTATFTPIVGQTAIWTNSAGGYWSTAGNWQNGLVPGPGTNVDINANGTYTSTASGTNTCGNIALGTTSSYGVQTFAIYGLAPLNPLTFSNMTVGALGVFSYANNSTMNGTGLVTVASGGQLWGNGTFEGGFGGHDILVQGGGRWTTASGAVNPVASDPGRDTTYTINGTLDGPGTVNLNNQNNRNFFTGTGRLDVAQITLNANNGNLYLGGTLTVNSTIIQSNANGSAVVLTNGSTITLNGPYMMQGASSALLVFTNTDSATITGTNLISVRHDDNGNYGVFTGTKVGGGAGGSITIAGSGSLNVCQASTLNLRINAAVLNLQRNSSFWATTNAAAIRPNTGSVIINACGPGTTMTLDTNLILRLWSPGNILNVTNGASLAMRNAIVEGGNNSGGSLCTNVFVGCGSAATLALKANSTNTFRQSSEDLSALCILLGSNATLSAETGSVLQLQDCHLAIAFTNGNAWSWNTAGAVTIGTNVVFEAMNTDFGLHFPMGTADRSIKLMRLQSAGALTVTLANEGSADNDGDGITDSVVYVGLLDVSGMPGGATANVAGNGIATPKIYYRRLSNPNGVALGAGFVALPPAGLLLMVE